MTNYVWNGVDGNWFDTNDWTPTGFPNAFDNAFIGGTGSYTVTAPLTLQFAYVSSLTMDDAAATLDPTTGGGLVIGSTFSLEAGNITGNGVLNLDNALLEVSGTQTFASGTFEME